MNRNLVGIIGFLLILAGAFLPFAHLQQNPNDMAPALVGFVTFIVGVIVLFRAINAPPKKITREPQGFPVEPHQ